MADDFDPNSYLKNAGTTAVADAPSGFDADAYLKQVASPASPSPAPYTTSAIGRDLGSLKDAAFGNDATPEYLGDEGDFAKGLRSVPIAGPLLANIGHGIGSLASSAYDTAMDSRATAQVDVQKNGVFPAMAHQAGAIALAAPGAIYNTINPVANLIEKAGTDAVSDGARAIGGGLRIAGLPNAADAYSNAATNFEASKDADKQDVRQNYEQPAQHGILNLSPNPALTTAAQNVAPLLIPGGVGLEAAGINAKLGGLVGDAVEGGVNLVGQGAKFAAPAAGLVKGATFGGPVGGYFGLKGGLRLGDAISSAAPKVASALGGASGDLTTLGLNAATPAATGAALGLAGADPGQEVEGARAGLAQGALFSPISALAGAYTRQGMEQADLAKPAAIRGMAEYGDNPALDDSTAQGISKQSPEVQKAIFEQRGLMRENANAEGKQIQIHVPIDYADRATADNGGTVNDAANSRGYYLDGQGKIFINPDHADIPGAINEALGHEVGHSVYQDALPAVSARASTRLNNAVANQALDANLQPTPQFQSFINQYASAANGTPTTLDWNQVPVSGSGLTRTKLLNELGAETVRAATPNVGKQLAGREASDVIGDFASDLATRLGLRQAPNVAAAFGDTPVPVSVSALQAARKGTYAIGERARQGFDSPVRIAEPDPVKKTSGATKAQAETDQQSSPQPPPQEGSSASGQSSSTSPQPDTSFRQTQAYQDALKTLTSGAVGKKMDPVTATAMLDRAAQRPDVPDTLEDYLRFAQTGQAPRQAPNIAPVQPATPAENAPSLAPAASAQPTSPILAPTSQANAFGPPTPIGTSEGKRINLLYGAKRIEVPTATQPVLTLPRVTPKTEPVEPVNRLAGMEEPPATGPTDQAEVSTNPPLVPERTDGISSQTPNNSESQSAYSRQIEPDPASPERRGNSGDNQSILQTGKTSSPNPTPDTSAPASPLSSEDIARIESEAEKAFTPAPYKPQGTPGERAAKIAAKNAADLAKAKADAVAKAHSDSLPEGDTRVRAQVDPDTGGITLKGTHFVEGDAFHDSLLSRATDAEKANLGPIQDAIAQKKALNFDYDSAARVRNDQTNAQRQESQAISTATDRAQGVGLSEEANHTFVPLSVRPEADGSVSAYGYAPDKVLGNAEKVIPIMKESGLEHLLPYSGVNDPLYAQDLRNGAENHANGYSNQGVKLKPVEGVNVPQGDPNYQPHIIPPARANFVNLTMGDETALKAPQLKNGKETNSGVARRFAAANDNVPAESGEVNPLRDELNRKGVLQVGSDKGSKNVLEPAFESIKPGLITRFHDTPGTSEVPPLRASSFEGDRGSIAPGGQVPSSRFASAGFLPARPESLPPSLFDLPPAERAAEMKRLQSFTPKTRGAQATIRPETYDFTTPSGSNVVGRQQDVRVDGKIDPKAGELFSIESKKPGDGLSLALDAINFLRHAGKDKIVFNHIGTGDGRALVDGLQKIKAVGEPLGKFDSNSEVYSLYKDAPQSSASFLPAREAGAATPEQVADAAKAWKEQGTDSPYFQKWFSGSKVTDDKGEPLVIHHGTAPSGFVWTPQGMQFPDKDFTEFKTPSYFASNRNYAADFAKAQADERALGNHARVIDGYLSIKNPYDARDIPDYWKHLRTNTNKEVSRVKALGHDGILLNEVDPADTEHAGDIWMAFDPEQIKTMNAGN